MILVACCALLAILALASLLWMPDDLMVQWGLAVAPAPRPPAVIAAALPDKVMPHVLAETIPQDPEKSKAQQQARAKWYHETTVAAFERVGHKSPRWNAEAREAMAAVARHWSPLVRRPSDRALAWKAAKRAIDKGCDDPFILYVYARLGSGLHSPTPDEAADLFLAAADSLAASAYPSCRKAHAQYNAATALFKLKTSDERRDQIEGRLDACLALLPDAWQENQVQGRDEVYELATLLQEKYRAVLGDRKTGMDRIDAVLSKLPDRALTLAIRGHGYIQYAWDARGIGLANTVTNDKFGQFRDRLLLAEADLSTAWKNDPTFAKSANEMITVAMGMSWPRDAMEIWFQRAMKADPDDSDACMRKLSYLEPKWLGSAEEMLAFARGCRKTENWNARLPFVVMRAHFSLSQYGPPQSYFQEAVWNEVKEVYEAYIRGHPDSQHQKAILAQMAHQYGYVDDAAALFRDLGPDDWLDVFSSAREYEQTRAQVLQGVAAGNP